MTRHPFIAVELALTLNQPFLFKRFFETGIAVTGHEGVKEVRDRQVVTFNISTNQQRVIENIDTVVFATMKKSGDALYHAPKGKVSGLHRIGDCVQPRLVIEAIWEGFTVGREV